MLATLTQLSEPLGGRHCCTPTLLQRKLGLLRSTKLLRNMVDGWRKLPAGMVVYHMQVGEEGLELEDSSPSWMES